MWDGPKARRRLEAGAAVYRPDRATLRAGFVAVREGVLLGSQVRSVCALLCRGRLSDPSISVLVLEWSSSTWAGANSVETLRRGAQHPNLSVQPVFAYMLPASERLLYILPGPQLGHLKRQP